jgi:hypothetical protein
MAYASGVELLYANTASGAANNTFTAERVINDTTSMGERFSLPPYYFTPPMVGRGLRIVARGIISTTGTPTFTLSCRLGTTGSTSACLALGSAAVTAGSAVSNQLWEFEGDIILRSFGASGAASTIQGLGHLSGPAFSTTEANLFAGAATPGTVATFDPGITNFVNFNAACGTSSASNAITLLQLLVFGLN